jgi:hypothetical protein
MGSNLGPDTSWTHVARPLQADAGIVSTFCSFLSVTVHVLLIVDRGNVPCSNSSATGCLAYSSPRETITNLHEAPLADRLSTFRRAVSDLGTSLRWDVRGHTKINCTMARDADQRTNITFLNPKINYFGVTYKWDKRQRLFISIRHWRLPAHLLPVRERPWRWAPEHEVTSRTVVHCSR